MEQTGGNASMIPCSPSPASAQANCPDNFICYNVSIVTNYCVPGTTTSKDYPIDQSSEIKLTCETNCKSGICDTSVGSQQWGQCSCQSDADCQTSQNCHHVTQNNMQCYWGFDMVGSQLAANGGTTYKCTSATECTDHQLKQIPNQANIYEVADGTSYYKVTATQNSNSHSCMFKIPESGCIERLNQTGVCAPWLVAETGAWYGRSIQVPANSVGVIP